MTMKAAREERQKIAAVCIKSFSNKYISTYMFPSSSSIWVLQKQHEQKD